MKKPASLDRHGLYLILSIFFFTSCKKTADVMFPVFSIKVINTTPKPAEQNVTYDGNVSASLNQKIDTISFNYSLVVSLGDSTLKGTLQIQDSLLTFTPEIEMLPATPYTATVSVLEKGKTEPVYTYQWKFTTKTADEYVMNQTSNTVTDFIRDGTRSVQVGNYLYSFGGWHMPEESFNDVYRSSGDLTQWEKLPDAPWHGRHVYGIAKIADSTYIIGGDNLHQLFDVWRTTDGENWTLLAHNVLNNRIFFGCTVHNGHIYIVGGNGYNDVWRSSNGITWEQVTDDVGFLNKECFAGSLASFNGKLWMVCGGTNGFGQGEIRKEVWSSIDGKDWKQEKDFGGSKRYYTDVCVWDNKLWVVGGYNFSEGNVRSIWYMKPDGTWKEFETPDNYLGRHATGIATYNNNLVITCGNYNNDCWIIKKIN